MSAPRSGRSPRCRPPAGGNGSDRSLSARACPQTLRRPTLRRMETSELTDTQWERLRPLLPAQKPRTGRPANDHRTVLNGILWILRTGSPWRTLPERYGSWKTVSSRFYRWQRAGVWDRILSALQRRADADGRLDWTLHFVDSTVVRAHQHAAGAKGGPCGRGSRPQPRRVRHEGPPAMRAGRQADGRRADRGRAARAARVAAADGARGGQAAGTGMTAHPARARGRG